MVAGMISSTRHRKMNESSVNLQDEIVQNVASRIHQKAKDYFEGPLKLLEGFDALEGLLSGRQCSSFLFLFYFTQIFIFTCHLIMFIKFFTFPPLI
jgi:ABC-type protease/lipase transport system fused ATPase/permease subunit